MWLIFACFWPLCKLRHIMCSCSLLFFTQCFHCLFTSVGNAFQLSWRCCCPAHGLVLLAEWSALGSPCCKKGWNQIIFAVGSGDFCSDKTRRSHSLCLHWHTLTLSTNGHYLTGPMKEFSSQLPLLNFDLLTLLPGRHFLCWDSLFTPKVSLLSLCFLL